MKISLVIPVYNEAHQIRGCLESVALQTRMPDEVIVVDNNCTDNTIALAKKYPFVRVVTEKKQGRGYARSAGFDEAHGDVIGRIDADTRLTTEWVERVLERFSTDGALQGITGLGNASFIPGVQAVRTTLFARCYYWFVHASFRTVTMWGANMAIRKTAWLDVRDRVSNDDTLVHEDQDISLWIAANGGKILQDNALRITTSGQTYRYLPKIIQYIHLFRSTKQLHTKNGNLSSVHVRRLKLLPLIPGMVFALVMAGILLVFVTLFFPIDYFIARRLKKTEWLE